MRYALAAFCVVVLGASASAETLVDQLSIVDTYEYDQGVVASVIGGWSLLGKGNDHDSQVVDDFTVGGAGCVITDVWFDYLCFWGGGAPPSSLIEVFPDEGGHPGEDAAAYAVVGTESSPWTPIVPGIKGERHHASGLDIELAAGHYWISMQPITLQNSGGNGDIYYAVQDTDTTPPPGGDTYFREGGIDPDVNHDGSLGLGPLYYSGGLNQPDFITMQAEGLGAGNTSFRVDGVPLQTPGDANGDGKVDGGDLAIWQQHYDPLGLNANNTFEMGDFNRDGQVDGGDLALWQQNYNPLGSPGLGAAASVPEPATLVLLGSVLLAALGIGRRRWTK